MSDWRKAWFTYGGESDNAIVNPETGEAEYEITDIDGVLPDDLVGILYRNGPGKFGVNGERVAHILDADGLVLRFEFRPPSYAGNRVKFTSRFIETEGFIEEREKQQFTKRGTFGTAPTPDWYKLNRNGLNADPAEKPPLLTRVVANALNVDIKNTANTQVIAFGGKVLALWEAGMPYSLDPVTLQTIGIDSLGLKAICELRPWSAPGVAARYSWWIGTYSTPQDLSSYWTLGWLDLGTESHRWQSGDDDHRIQL